MDIERLVIANPSGNITAIVFDEVAHKDMREIGAMIQDEYPSVEQVLFVQKRGNRVHGQMAGGEFCGNGARALGYVLADGGELEQVIGMSGLSKPVTVRAEYGRAIMEITTHLRREDLLLANAPVAVIHIEDEAKHIDGISHAVIFPEHPLYYSLKTNAAKLGGKEIVKEVLDDLDLTKHKACGLMFAEKRPKGINLTPYVFVKEIGTLCAETACASGSIAVTRVVGASASLFQPSGEILHVSLQGRGKVIKAKVDGSMSIISDGPALDLGEPKRLAGSARVRRSNEYITAQAG